MAINTDLLTATQVAEAQNILADIFTDSNVDAGVGTSVRELVVRPMAILRAAGQAEQDDFFNKLNLYAVANGGESNSDTIDAVASTYRIKRMSGKPASGTVLVELVNNVMTYIPLGVTFSYGEYVLYLDKTYVIIPTDDNTTYTDTEDVSYLHPYTLNSKLYAVIPAHTQTGVVDVLPTGTPLAYEGTINNVSSYSVLSPIAGGSAPETDQELASRILYGVVKGYLSTPLQIKAAFMDEFEISPNNIAVFGINDTIVNRSVNPITGISQGGFVDIYANVTKSVATNYVSGIAESDDTSSGEKEREFSFTLSQDDSAGVYDIKQVFAVSGTPIYALKVTYGMFTNSHHLSESDARFTKFQKIMITFKAVTASAFLPITIETIRMNNISDLQNFVDSDERRTPGQDIIVKAAIPCFIDLSVTVKANTSEYDVDAMKQALIAKIHNMPIGSDAFTAEDIISALEPYDVILKFPVMIKGTIITPKDTIVSATTTAAYNLPTYQSAVYDRNAVSFFSDLDRINLVVGK